MKTIILILAFAHKSELQARSAKNVINTVKHLSS